MKIVLDTTILVRANERSHGLARELLTTIIESKHTLLLSNEMLNELAKVLRRASEIVILNPLLTAPIRDVNDIIVMQTAIIGEADILCTKDDDFFEEPASEYLSKLGITVLDDISLMHRIRA